MKRVIRTLIAVALGCGSYKINLLAGWSPDYAMIAALIIALYGPIQASESE